MEQHQPDARPASAKLRRGTIIPLTPATRASISEIPVAGTRGDGWLAVPRTLLRQPVEAHPAPADVCATCHGAGWIGFDVPVGHPKFGKTVRCQNCDAHQWIAFAAVQKYTCLPPDLVEMAVDWTTFPAEMDAAAIDAMQRYSTRIRDGDSASIQGIILMGLNQVGKSGLAYCVHEDLLAARIPSVFIGEVDLLDLLTAAMFDREHPDHHLDMLDRLATVSHLVLDDLGSAKPTEKREEFLFQLLDQRGKNPKTVTTITTNLDVPDLKAHLGKRVYARIAGQSFSRLVVAGAYCALVGGDTTS